MADEKGVSEFEAAFLRGREAGVQIDHSRLDAGGTPYLVLPEGFEVKSLEWLLDRPLQRKAQAAFSEQDSFIGYVRQFAGSETQLCADVRQGVVIAILDYHEGGKDGRAGHGKHVAKFLPLLSEEWLAWTGKDGKALSQLQFAEFIEERLRDIREPDGAALLEMAQNFSASRSAKVESSKRLSDGRVQFVYVEELAGGKKGAAGLVTVLERLRIGLYAYEGDSDNDDAPVIDLEAWLRWRLKDGDVSFTVKLDKPGEALRHTFRARAEEIGAELARPVLYGSLAVG